MENTMEYVKQLVASLIYTDTPIPDGYPEMCEPLYHAIKQEIYRQMEELENQRKLVSIVVDNLRCITINDDSIKTEVVSLIPFMLERWARDSMLVYVERKGECIGTLTYSGTPYVGPSPHDGTRLCIGTTGRMNFDLSTDGKAEEYNHQVITGILKEMQEKMKNHVYDFNQKESSEKFADRYNEFMSQISKEQFGIRFEEPNIIHFIQDPIDPKVFAFIPFILDEVKEYGTYQVYISGKEYGSVTYNGRPKNSDNGQTILAGVKTELHLITPMHYCEIDITVDDKHE